jgi:hypothetical protein
MEIIAGLITFLVGTCFSGLLCLLPLIVIGLVLATAMGAINAGLKGK